ncbi:DNA polymerase III subunit delta [Phragmitibacter flavus]|uniref:DNA polymerase III subunit delta n=1 Tax=Phragmitibacter flavus TaxID=2576071 RepID=A0A5R8KM01_9BACT|nr:DNA polymerase III subunit delta [Phragmitibacter flavus]TLD72839.1 DNA polymerase III subunit delta [Phragmitibacter flavus]
MKRQFGVVMAVKKASATSGGAGNIIAVVGTDDLRVKEAALKLSKELSPPDSGDFGNDVIEGIAESAEHCGQIVRSTLDALQTLPFFGGGKLVWLKNVNFLADSVVGRTNAAIEGMEAILDYAEKLPPEIKFLMSVGAVDKRRAAWKKLSKVADVRVFDRPDTTKSGWEDAVIAQVERRGRDLGLRFDHAALEMLVHLAGEDTRQLDSEIEKLSLYVGENGRVTEDVVRLLVPLNRAGVVFELGNAIGRRDLRRALELVRTLIYQGQNAIGILLAAVVPRVRNLLLAADLLERHPKLPRGSYGSFGGALERLPSSETAHLPKKKDGSGLNVYPLFLALNEASKFTLPELRAALKACLEANLKLVSTSIEPQLVLERLLVGMLTKKR